MSWKCNLLGHKFSQWLEDKEAERQERWCNRCQFLEISRLVLEEAPQCHKNLHKFGRWGTHPTLTHVLQARYCQHCNLLDSRQKW